MTAEKNGVESKESTQVSTVPIGKIATSLTLVLEYTTIDQGSSMYIWASLKDSSGKTIAVKPVKITVGSEDITNNTNSSGVHRAAWNFHKLLYAKGKTYTVTASFAGDATYEGCVSGNKSVYVK